jgi:thymidylate synthase
MDIFNKAVQSSMQRGSTEISARTIGEAWIKIASRILSEGVAHSYDGRAIREILRATLTVSEPHSNDGIISQYANEERLAWMHANFTDFQNVSELGGADSYATRLRNYEKSGRNQINWVIEKLRGDMASRSATITTFQPLSDTSYIPCVSLLDFFIVDDAVELVVYAHSIDFGTKGYANLVELAYLQEEVAHVLSLPLGTLMMVVKSAHVYGEDLKSMERVIRSETTFEYQM